MLYILWGKKCILGTILL